MPDVGRRERNARSRRVQVPRRAAVLLAAVALAPLAPSRGAARPAIRSRQGSGDAIHDTTLANGLTVIVSESHAVPLATVEVVVRTGAFTQEPGDQGISHLYEHLLFRAYGPKQQFAGEVADLKGAYNGSTGEEEVNYYVTAPSAGVVKMIRMMSKLVTAPSFRGDDIEAERQIVTNEFERDASESQFVLRDAIGRRLWGGYWPRKDALGTRETIRAITADRLKQTYQRYYVPGNAALIVTGDVETAAVIEAATREFGGWRAGPDPHAQWPEPMPEPLAATNTFVVSAPHQALVTLSISWQGPSVRREAAMANAANVFAAMVSSPTSPLVDRVVNAGYAQSASMTYSAADRSGPVTLEFEILPGVVDRAIRVIRGELNQLDSQDYVNDSLLDFARRSRAVDAAFELGAGSRLAGPLGHWWAVAGLDYYRGRSRAQDSLTVADVQRYVRERLMSARYVVGALTAPADSAVVRRLVESTFGTPSPSGPQR